MHSEKGSLSIRLTEPVVPLHIASVRASHQGDPVLSPAIVRGLLTLNLAKPTKISSIELELQARATTQYVRGVGPTNRIDVTEEYKVHSTSTVVFNAGTASRVVRQHVPSSRSRAPSRDVQTWPATQHGTRLSGVSGGHLQAPSGSRCTSSDSASRRVRRQLSPDGLDAHNSPHSSVPAPPYLQVDGIDVDGRSPSVASSSRIRIPLGSPVPSRNRLTPDILLGSPVSSEHSIYDSSLTRTSSIEEVPEDENEGTNAYTQRPDDVAYYGLSRIGTGSSGRSSEQDRRGRSQSRFSLGRIVHVLEAVKDRVRSRSRSIEREERGRSLHKGQSKAQFGLNDAIRVQTGITEPSAADDANAQGGDGWAVFPEGTYTYPIFFTIPNDSPPTLKAEHGSLIWCVKAKVKRPGMFQSNMTTHKEVTVVRLLKDDDPEDGISLQREWEDQFQYRVQIPGRGFPVGGKIPFELTITPLAKIKVHSISAFLDERTEYYARAESQVRSSATRRATLLVIKHNSFGQRCSKPILPLMMDEPDEFYKSPLYHLLGPGEHENETESSFMGLGPWTIRHPLSIPNSCSILHPSNQTKGSNVMVNHTLEVTLRVEKEEEIKTGEKKKLYDIVIRAPIQIMSCHCTSEWRALPRYDEVLRSELSSPNDMLSCPCHTQRAKVRRRTAADSLPVPLECRAPLPTCPNLPSPSDSLASHIRLYEQRISGLVSERGEAPPLYEYSEAIYV